MTSNLIKNGSCLSDKKGGRRRYIEKVSMVEHFMNLNFCVEGKLPFHFPENVPL